MDEAEIYIPIEGCIECQRPAVELLQEAREALRLYRLRHIGMYSGTDPDGGPDCTCGCCVAARPVLTKLLELENGGRT